MTSPRTPRRRRGGSDENRYRPRDHWEQRLVADMTERYEATRAEEAEE